MTFLQTQCGNVEALSTLSASENTLLRLILFTFVGSSVSPVQSHHETVDAIRVKSLMEINIETLMGLRDFNIFHSMMILFWCYKDLSSVCTFSDAIGREVLDPAAQTSQC